jgi:cytochrome d ubiquinol oxidase subunit I
LLGHESGKVAEIHQPAKVAAMEGWWSSGVQPSILLGWPDDRTETTHVLVQAPKGWGSWIVAGRSDAALQGLKAWPRSERPPSLVPFWSFRVMVGLGLLMIGIGWWGAWLWRSGRLDRCRPFQAIALVGGPAGFLAVLAGWTATEVGRQPYVVYGLLRTDQAASPVAAASVGASLLLFMIVYAIVFTAGAIYIGRLLVQGPSPQEGPARTPEPPGNPLALASGPAPGAHTKPAE